MGDDCRSYNLGIGTVPEVVLPKPPWSSRDEGIAVDACIANVVQAVWDAGFVTLGSCCGHGIEGPELVLGDSVQAHDVPEIERIIARHDTRRWTLLQWQLVPLNTGGHTVKWTLDVHDGSIGLG